MVPCRLRVIYGDTDQMGVVYYANYLRWFEAGRSEFLREKGLSYAEFEAREKMGLPVTEASVRYLQSAHFDDLVVVETRLVQIRRASARFEYRVVRGDDLLATGLTVHACVDGGGRIRRLPEDFLSKLVAGEELEPGR